MWYGAPSSLEALQLSVRLPAPGVAEGFTGLPGALYPATGSAASSRQPVRTAASNQRVLN